MPSIAELQVETPREKKSFWQWPRLKIHLLKENGGWSFSPLWLVLDKLCDWQDTVSRGSLKFPQMATRTTVRCFVLGVVLPSCRENCIHLIGAAACHRAPWHHCRGLLGDMDDEKYTSQVGTMLHCPNWCCRLFTGSGKSEIFQIVYAVPYC